MHVMSIDWQSDIIVQIPHDEYVILNRNKTNMQSVWQKQIKDD